MKEIEETVDAELAALRTQMLTNLVVQSRRADAAALLEEKRPSWIGTRN